MVGCSNPATGQSLRNGRDDNTSKRLATGVNVRDPQILSLKKRIYRVAEEVASQRTLAARWPKAPKLDTCISIDL